MKLKDYTTAQQRAWDEIAPVHKASEFEKLSAGFQQPGYSCLDVIETELLQSIDLNEKSVVQLGCNNGRELLSIKNLGAGRCVGFDISGAFIDQARALAQLGKIDCQFEHLDVYDIPNSYDQQFDLVYLTVGVICWMPDLGSFFDVIERLLKPTGIVLIYDIHPFLGMFSEQDKSNLAVPTLSYFNKQPILDSAEGLDYYSHTNHQVSPRWWFHYPISDIFEVTLTRKMSIVSFKEYEHDISNVYSHLERQKAQLPLSYTLVLQKK